MRTRFDVVLHGANHDSLNDEATQDQTAWLRAVAVEALAEIEAAEKRFNFYDPDSWLSRVNQRAAQSPVQVPADVFQLLELCLQIFTETDGVFDPAAASPASFAEVELIAGQRQVRFHHPQLQIDLGGIAKGWAIDLATETLLDEGVTSALVQGGSSSVRAVGAPPGQSSWKVQLAEHASTWLHNQALGVSHTFADDGSTEEPTCHIIDPARGEALRCPQLAAVLCPAEPPTAYTVSNDAMQSAPHPAAVADAWATALLLRHSQPFTWKQLP